jgi:hypothetical protein
MANLNPLLASMSEIEKEVFELWKDYDPTVAFTGGLEEYAGRMFIPTQSNVHELATKIQVALKKAKEKNQRKLLECLGILLEYREPHRIPLTATNAFFAHLVKEGINKEHLSSLVESAERALTAGKAQLGGKKWAIEAKITACQCCDGLKGILNAISEETADTDLKGKLKKLIEVVEDYRKAFNVEGIIEGDFTEIFPILEKLGGDLGHRTIYPRILKLGWDIYETTTYIEQKALRQIRKELPLFRSISKKLAKIYGCEPTYEEINKAMEQRNEIPKAKAIEYVSDLRKKLLPVVVRRLVRKTPKYDTRIMETPPYLLNFISTAAMTAFDTLTDKPFSIIFITTDEKRSPPSSAADLINMIIHEETGHCFHIENSATGFAAKPQPVDLMDSWLSGPVSDGISFHREYEFVGLLRKLAGMDEGSLSNEEKEFLATVRGKEDLKEALLQNEFVMMKWRLVRFLRAIFDTRVNMGKQTVVDFVKWGTKTTGLSEKLIFNQTWQFLQTIGYAPVYFIGGDSLRVLQEKAIRSGVDVVDFNTYATSIGIGARTIFEERLKTFIKDHAKKRRART